jgi:glycine cleavage system H protein
MDGFSYTNIFDTKGIEYLVIISFLLLLIPFWLILNKQVKFKEQIQKILGVLSANILKIPQGIFYNKNHTWTFLEKSGSAKVGLDDLLLHITGNVDIKNLKTRNEEIKKGELLAELDQNGKSLKIYSPISGKILTANENLKENKQLLNQDPYGKGWIYEIKPSNWVTETSTWYFAEEAQTWMKSELDRYKSFLSMNFRKYSPESESLTILQDGGELSENSLSELPNEMWQEFQKEFLNS